MKNIVKFALAGAMIAEAPPPNLLLSLSLRPWPRSSPDLLPICISLVLPLLLEVPQVKMSKRDLNSFPFQSMRRELLHLRFPQPTHLILSTALPSKLSERSLDTTLLSQLERLIEEKLRTHLTTTTLPCPCWSKESHSNSPQHQPEI